MTFAGGALISSPKFLTQVGKLYQQKQKKTINEKRKMKFLPLEKKKGKERCELKFLLWTFCVRNPLYTVLVGIDHMMIKS
jgi:hypothetical protein